MFKLSDYDYDLPPELIAQQKTNPPHNSKMLIYDRGTWEIKHKKFLDLTQILDKNRVIFFNKSKVIRARLQGMIEGKDAEIFYLRMLDNWTFEALIRPWKKFRLGSTVKFEIGGKILEFEVMWFSPEGRILKSLSWDILNILDKYGQMPLPPYIKFDKSKTSFYQPLLAQEPWSVAAPTASLHFSHQLLSALEAKGLDMEYVILHVWLGTFKKVDVEDITKYDIHTEQVKINKDIFSKIAWMKSNWKRILSVGTTVLRTLESLPALWYSLPKNIKDSYSNETQSFWNSRKWEGKQIIYNLSFDKDFLLWETKLFIYPWFRFQIVDSLITNFHLPKSSLLMLVAAFMGYENMKKIYQQAIERKYKFYSFGDGMFII